MLNSRHKRKVRYKLPYKSAVDRPLPLKESFKLEKYSKITVNEDVQAHDDSYLKIAFRQIWKSKISKINSNLR